MSFLRKPIDIAPDVVVPAPDYYLPDRSSGIVPYNSTVDRMYAPALGPAISDGSVSNRPTGQGQLVTGFIEKSNLSEWTFEHQFRTMNRDSCPEDTARDLAEKKRHRSMYYRGGMDGQGDKASSSTKEKEGEVAVVGDGEDTDDDLGDGKPRKRPREDQSHVDPKRMMLVAKKGGNAISLEGDDEKEGLTVYFEEDEKRGKRVARFEAIPPINTLHIKQAYDYQGRSFLHDPLKDVIGQAYIPKRLVHTYRGHNRGVGAIQWFPPHGHLILSAGLDCKVKLWDVCNTREVIQTYIGHAKAVKAIALDHTGEKFISAGFDRFIRVWDTETGKALHTFTTGKQPHCTTFHGDWSKQNIFMCGMADKKIVQWDLRTDKITQEYDQHMGPVNTIQFVDNNRKFVTTSDDKTVRMWEWDIPFALKVLAESTMQSMPTCTPSPDGKFLAYQSMDNSIQLYQAQGEKFRQYHKKSFKAHIVSGYACQIAWSNDSKYICSGDGDGNVWFWDFKTSRVVKRMKVHDRVCIGLLWHPVDHSKIATCSWDATIKLWD